MKPQLGQKVRSKYIAHRTCRFGVWTWDRYPFPTIIQGIYVGMRFKQTGKPVGAVGDFYGNIDPPYFEETGKRVKCALIAFNERSEPAVVLWEDMEVVPYGKR